MNLSVPDSAATVVTFVLAYTLKLFSQCLMFYFLFRHQIYLRCEHSPFVRRGECDSYIGSLRFYRSIGTCMYLTLLVSIYVIGMCLGMYLICTQAI